MTNTSALYLAIRIENVDIVKMIVEVDHNWNEYDKNPFHKSCFLKAIEIYHRKQKQNLDIIKISEIIEILLEKKFDVNITSYFMGVHIYDYFNGELDIKLISKLFEYGLHIPDNIKSVRSLLKKVIISSDRITEILKILEDNISQWEDVGLNVEIEKQIFEILKLYERLQKCEMVALCVEKRMDILDEVDIKYGIDLNACSICETNRYRRSICVKSQKEYLGTINNIVDVPNIMETIMSFIS